MQISMPYRKIQRPTTLELAPPGTFPVNPRKKYKHLHIKLGKNHAYTQKNNQSNQWLWQISFSQSFIRLLQATLYPSQFYLRYYFTIKCELLVSNLKNIHIDCL